MMNEPDEKLIEGLIAGAIGLYCSKCGYNLRGLAGEYKICPECGMGVSMTPAAVSKVELALGKSRIRETVWWIAFGEVVLFALIIGGVWYAAGFGFRSAFWEEIIQGFFCLAIPILLFLLLCLGCGLSRLRKRLPGADLNDIVFRHGVFRFLGVLMVVVLLVGCVITLRVNGQDIFGANLPFALLVSGASLLLCVVIFWYRVIRPGRRLSRDDLDQQLQGCVLRSVRVDHWDRLKKRIDWSSVPEGMKNRGSE